jgi:dolichyl-phosphate beta-glucosyltransferase
MAYHNSANYEMYESWKTQPISDEPYLSIVIPAYNEAERILPTVGAMASYVSSQGIPWELIIADDGSTDDTVELLQGLNLANVRVLVAERNGGKGSAVRRGMMAARGKYVLFADADNSTPIEQLGLALEQIENGSSVVVGSRAADGAEEKNRGFLRNLMSGTLRWMVNNILHIGVSDTQCGFKLFTKEAATQLCEHQTLMGFSFDLELLYLSNKYGYTVTEVPVQWYDSPGSKVDPIREARRFLKDLATIKLNDARGLYAKG